MIGLKSVCDGQVVDVSGGSTATGTAIIQFPANGGQNQMWTLAP